VIQLEQNLKGAIMNKLKGLIGVALAVMTVSAGLSGTAHAAGPTMTNITVVPPLMPASVGIAGDFAPGFGNGSIAGNGLVKAELYLTPQQLFGRDVTLAEVANMSYWTKKAGDHASAPSDWFLALYTKPYAGDVSTATWHGDRIGAEPYFSVNIVETPGDWNQWTTNGTTNMLRFFESTNNSYFGSYTDPDWSGFLAAPALSGQPRGPQQVLYFSVQTGSAWAVGFTGQVDGLRIELTDGSVANVNFEPVVPCTATCYVNATTGNDAFGGDTPATAKKTIQAAVTQVSANGTVIVAAGAYTENVTIAKAVTLNGAQATVATSGRTFSDAAESTLTGQILVNAADVTIDGFSLTNPGQAFGIVVKTAGNNAQIKNNFIQNVGALTLPGGGGAQAVYLENGPDDVSIIGNDMQNISSDRSVKAILIGDSSSVNPSENVTVEGNSMANITSAVRGAYGLIANNGAGTSNLIVRDNTIDTLTGSWAHGIGLEGPTPNALVEFNRISNFTTLGSDSIAVFFEANPVYATSKVNRNSFTFVVAGIAVHPLLPAGAMNATCNWWGAATGPSGANIGSGVVVGPNVVFTPWLITSDLNAMCNGGTARGNKQVVRAMLAALPLTGDTKVDKSLTKALESVNDSLNPAYWADDNNLTDKGNKVFDEEKKAVQELQKVTGINVTWAITSLVQVDRALAEAAINSVNCGTDTKCQKELNKAQEALVKGNTEAAKPDPDKAIDNYKKAWETAVKAK
jgi:hypothetical protein